MPCTSRLMALGDWSLGLVDETPRYLLDLLDPLTAGWSLVCVTWPPLPPAREYTPIDVLSAAWYTGVLTAWDGQFQLSGPGAAALLGDSDGVGPLLGLAAGATLAPYLTIIVDALLPENGINVGTVVDTSYSGGGGGEGIDGSYQWQILTKRGVLDRIAASHQAEWRLNPSLSLDMGPVASLWTTSNAVLLTPGTPDDPEVTSIDARIERQYDVEEWTTAVTADRGDAQELGNYQPAPANAKRFYVNGQPIVRTRKINVDPEATDAEADQRAAIQAGRFTAEALRVQTPIQTDDPILGAKLRAGQPVDLCDAANGVEGDVARNFHGRILGAIRTRTTAVMAPVTKGMGVYVVTSEATPRVLDLSSWVEWEEPSGTIEVGSYARPLSGENRQPPLPAPGDTSTPTTPPVVVGGGSGGGSGGNPVGAPILESSTDYRGVPQATTFTAPLPTGLIANRLLVLRVLTAGQTVTTPSGFTLLSTVGDSNRRQYVFYRILDGTEGS